jgi:hypothetical protein
MHHLAYSWIVGLSITFLSKKYKTISCKVEKGYRVAWILLPQIRYYYASLMYYPIVLYTYSFSLWENNIPFFEYEMESTQVNRARKPLYYDLVALYNGS